MTKEEEHTPDDYLIREGETETDLYILLEGTVEVVKDGTVITELEPESVMGEMSLLSDSPTSADCVSTSHVRVLTIPREDFRELLYGDHPEIPLGLLKVLTRRLEETTRRAVGVGVVDSPGFGGVVGRLPIGDISGRLAVGGGVGSLLAVGVRLERVVQHDDVWRAGGVRPGQ